MHLCYLLAIYRKLVIYMDNIKILLKKSNQLDQQTGAPKEPSESEHSYGEIAVNYHDGSEKIFVKNDNDEIASFATEEQIDTKLANKQDTLVSGTNIKTINNESILGSGNINVGLPSVSSTDNGKILKVVDGQWTLVDPVTVYTGTDEPSSLLGQDGDIYLQTE